MTVRHELDAVITLLRASLGSAIDDQSRDNLAKADPEQIVAIASSHMVLPQLGLAFDACPSLSEALPEDLIVFLREMLAANTRRNRKMRMQLETVGVLASELGQHATVLKGGIELIEQRYPAPGARVISDLDLLAEEQSLMELMHTLQKAGWQKVEDTGIDAASHHHLHALYHPDWPAQIELHRQIAPEPRCHIVTATDMLSHATLSCLTGLSIPSGSHRLSHLLVHGILGHARFQQQAVSLRDIADLAILSTILTSDDWAQAERKLDDQSAGWALKGLAATCEQIFPGRVPPGVADKAGVTWAEAALRDMANPNKARARQGLIWLKWYITAFLTDPDRRRHYLDRLTTPGGLSRLIRFHRDRDRRIR